MKRLLFLLALLICSVCCFSQTPRPVGAPTQFNTGWQKWGYQQSDSGTIIAKRDTNFIPRFAGTVILWQRASDTSYWFHTNGSPGGRWARLLKEGEANNTYANNGLTKDGDTVELGGTLNQSTTVALNGNNFQFTGTGNIGIGTSSQTDKFHVVGKSTFTDSLRAQKMIQVGSVGNNAVVNFLRTSDAANMGQLSVNGNEFIQNGVAGFIQIQSATTAKMYVTPSGVRVGFNANAAFASQLESASLVLLPGDTSANRGAPLKFTLDGAQVLNTIQRGVMEAKSNYLMWTDSLLNRDTLATRRWVRSEASGFITASNGLTKVGSDIILGGILTDATFIEANNKQFIVTQASDIGLLSYNTSTPDNYGEVRVLANSQIRLRNNLNSNQRTDIIMDKQRIKLEVDYDLATYINKLQLDTNHTFLNSRVAIYDLRYGEPTITSAGLRKALNVLGTSYVRDTLFVGKLPLGNSSDSVVVWRTDDSSFRKVAQSSIGGGGMAIGAAITSATAGSGLYVGTNGLLQQSNSGFFYDSTNIRLGIGTGSPARSLHVSLADAATNSISAVARFSHSTSGTPAAGFGLNREISLPNSGGTQVIVATENYSSTDVTPGSEDVTFGLSTMTNGSLSNKLTVLSSSNVGLSGQTAPASPLHIGTGTIAGAFGGAVGITLATAGNAYLQLSQGTRTFAAGADGSAAFAGTTTNHNLEIRANNSTKMTITTGSEVFIGSTTDQGAFTLQNTGGFYQNGLVQLRGIPGHTTGQTIFVHNADSGLYQIPFSTFATNNIATSDLTLTGNRILSGGGFSLELGASGGAFTALTLRSSDNITLSGSLNLSPTVTATDANYTVLAGTVIIVLPTITANRIVSLPAATAGKFYIVWNQNSSGNNWSFSGAGGATVIDAAGGSITNLTNDTVYMLLGTGTDFLKIN